MENIIYVSFKQEEMDLKREIERRSELMSVSGWMKVAAKEKIQRENNQEIALIDKFINGQ